MKAGEFFGERALLYDEPRSAKTTAFGSVIVLALSRESLTRALGSSLMHAVHVNTMRNIFSFSEVLSSLMPT
jgi:cGMP-dependent protein kinase